VPAIAGEYDSQVAIVAPRRIHVSPSVKECPDDDRMSGSAGSFQSGGPGQARRVDISASVQQRLDDLRVPAFAGNHQGQVSMLTQGVRICSGFE
jgi:hypothetical protein